MDFIPITVIDIIDIVLVALIMYYLYKIIRGTHATSILSGILLIYVIWVIVRALNMELLSAILGNVISVGIIALIVIFQPEVRKFLQVLGTQTRSRQHSFFSRFFDVKYKDAPDTRYIDPIVSACADMSASKTGALIVIRQRGDLQDIIDTGVMLDAVISSSLLKNIFFKNSPLHDGAVVVGGGRVIAAKCVLPSTQSEVPLSFGMRHRAALGISEVSDALVVVVSEETGAISIADAGRINCGLSATELKAELMKHAARPQDGGDGASRHGRRKLKEDKGDEKKASGRPEPAAAPDSRRQEVPDKAVLGPEPVQK